MPGSERHDAWQGGASYEVYMGRWSRQVAPRFLDWLGAPNDLDWLEVGCGTGALATAILERCRPRSLIAIDPSDGFVDAARARLHDDRAAFRVGDVQALDLESASRDVVASALVLNFVPDKVAALAEMKRVTRSGGMIGFYVWDYPGGGVDFIREFWDAAVTLDPAAADLAEDRRFSFCTPDGLTGLAREAGLQSIECTRVEVPTVFDDFRDFWRPFTLGTGPAPAYCTSLSATARDRLKDALNERLQRRADGTIAFRARAWAVRSDVA